MRAKNSLEKSKALLRQFFAFLALKYLSRRLFLDFVEHLVLLVRVLLEDILQRVEYAREPFLCLLSFQFAIFRGCLNDFRLLQLQEETFILVKEYLLHHVVVFDHLKQVDNIQIIEQLRLTLV